MAEPSETETTADIRTDILKSKLELARLELAMVKEGTLSAEVLKRITDIRAEGEALEQRLDTLDRAVVPKLQTFLLRHGKWVSIGIAVFWGAFTALALTHTYPGPTSAAKPEYYLAVATLLPVLLVAVFVQSAVPRMVGGHWLLIAQSAPIVAGEVIAVYALAIGHGTRAMVVLTAIASASAFVTLVTTWDVPTRR